MNYLKQRIHDLKRSLIRSITCRILWIADENLTLDGEIAKKTPILVIVGREYYREYRKKYPVANRAELRRVLALELQNQKGIFIRIGPLIDNTREVVFFEVQPAFISAPPRGFFWFPESLVVSMVLAESVVATVHRGKVAYFLSANGTNQLRGGAIVSPDLFRMGVGVPLAGPNIDIDRLDVLSSLRRGLSRLHPSDWWAFRSPELVSSAARILPPVALFSAFTILLYLSVISVYLMASTALRESQLERLGTDVAPLLEAQRRIDYLVAERASINAVLESRIGVWPMWEVAAEIWATGGMIISISFESGDVVVNGTAPSAIAVLERLASRKDVVWARFDVGVRQSTDGEQYAIRLRLKGRDLHER